MSTQSSVNAIVRQRIKEIRQEVEEMEQLAQCRPSYVADAPEDTAIDSNKFALLACVNNIGDACRSLRTQLRA